MFLKSSAAGMFWAIPTKGQTVPAPTCWPSGSIGSHVTNGIFTYTFIPQKTSAFHVGKYIYIPYLGPMGGG